MQGTDVTNKNASQQNLVHELNRIRLAHFALAVGRALLHFRVSIQNFPSSRSRIESSTH